MTSDYPHWILIHRHSACDNDSHVSISVGRRHSALVGNNVWSIPFHLHGKKINFPWNYWAFNKTMDNMDGKQARKTGNASSLGLLFDHGCDSISCTLLTISVCHFVQLRNTWISYLYVFLIDFGFWMNTLEEYFHLFSSFKFNSLDIISMSSFSL